MIFNLPSVTPGTGMGRILKKSYDYGRWRYSQLWRWLKPRLIFPLKYILRYRFPYDEKHFTVKVGSGHPETESYPRKAIRPQDMGSAPLYGVGITDYAHVKEILKMRHPTEPSTKDRFGQAEAVKQAMTRRPGLVFDVGSGRGEMSAPFTHIGIKSVPIDPARDAKDLTSGGRKARRTINATSTRLPPAVITDEL